MSNDKGNFNMSRLISVLNEEEGEGLVDPLKDKIQSLAGQHSDMLENLSPKVRKSSKFLQKFSQHDELEVNFFEEREALEAKYRKLYQPLHTKRYEILNGVLEVGGVTSKKRFLRVRVMKEYSNILETSSGKGQITQREFFFDTSPYLNKTVLTKTHSPKAPP